MKFLNNLERKIGKFYIRNLMFLVIMITTFVYALYSVNPQMGNITNLWLIPSEVMNGEVWRLLTFIFVPPAAGGVISMFFAIYLNYIAGSGLEHEWGGFKFNAYYLVGILTTIAVSFLTGAPATATAINLSLFLAFAKINPDYEFLLFFVLPVKVKWLATLNIILIVLEVFNKAQFGFGYVLVAITPLISYLLFFGKDIFVHSKTRATSAVRKHEFNSKIAEVEKSNSEVKECKVCGVTEIENPDMEFRYCSKCNGKFLYCSEHIREHEHIE